MSVLERNKEIRRLLSNKDYQKAIRLSEEVDWEKEENVRLLPEIARAYEQLGRIADAEGILLLAYKKGQNGKGNIYRLIEICAKNGDLKNGEYFYQEFKERWSNSNEMVAVEYYMSKLYKKPIKEQIRLLEVCCKENPKKEWLYELTKLYDQVGNAGACILACHKLIFYFGANNYTRRAIEIRSKYGELTLEEEEQLKMETKEKKPQLNLSDLKEIVFADSSEVENIKKDDDEDALYTELLNEIEQLKKEVDLIYTQKAVIKSSPIIEEPIIEEETEENLSLDPRLEEKTRETTMFCSWIRDYALESGAEIEDDVYFKLALLAENMQAQGKVLNRELALEMVKNAMDKARKRHLFSIFTNRYSLDGRLILQEKHFL